MTYQKGFHKTGNAGFVKVGVNKRGLRGTIGGHGLEYKWSMSKE